MTWGAVKTTALLKAMATANTIATLETGSRAMGCPVVVACLMVSSFLKPVLRVMLQNSLEGGRGTHATAGFGGVGFQ